MITRLYDILLDMEACLLLILSFYFVILYLKEHEKSFFEYRLSGIRPRYEPLKKIGFTILFGLILGLLALFQSWWDTCPLLCFAMIFTFSTIFIHESFILSFFIFLLFLRPWELIATKYDSQAEAQTIVQSTNFVSLPKLWFLLLLGVLIASWSFRKKIKLNILDLGVVIFVLWMLFPILLKNDVDEFRYFFETLFSSCLIYFVVRAFLNNEFSYQMIVKTFAFICFFLVATTILQYIFDYESSSKSERLEIFGNFGNANDLAALIVLSCPFFLRSFQSKIIKFLIVGVSLVAIYFTQSRGAFLGIIIGLLAYATSQVQFKNISKKKIVFLGVGLFSLFVMYSAVLGRSESEMKMSGSSRISYWIAAIRMAIYNPLWGVGYHNYPANFERYTTEFIEYGIRTAHSSFFLVLGEGGAIGLLIYLSLFKKGLEFVFKIRQVRPEVFGALLGYLITMFFLSHSYLSSVFILLAMTNSLYLMKEEVLSNNCS
jgi:O-antigen ligase